MMRRSIVDDLQYGFSAIVNNIAPFVASSRLTRGIANGGTDRSVAIYYQMYMHSDKLMAVLACLVFKSAPRR